jgi:hypothetical protein
VDELSRLHFGQVPAALIVDAVAAYVMPEVPSLSVCRLSQCPCFRCPTPCGPMLFHPMSPADYREIVSAGVANRPALSVDTLRRRAHSYLLVPGVPRLIWRCPSLSPSWYAPISRKSGSSSSFFRDLPTWWREVYSDSNSGWSPAHLCLLGTPIAPVPGSLALLPLSLPITNRNVYLPFNYLL